MVEASPGVSLVASMATFAVVPLQLQLCLNFGFACFNDYWA